LDIMQKIDIFNHIFPKPFHELMQRVAGDHKDIGKRVRGIPMLANLDERFRVMDRFGAEYRQILSLASPPLEHLGGPDVSTQLAEAANDGMADLVRQYPDRFPSFVASLPMNSPEGLVTETHRAIRDLGACGVQVFTNVLGKPLTAPEFRPLFAAMAEHDLPIWLHPSRGASFADYLQESSSKYEIWWTFGWPYETSVAMSRIVFDGVFGDHPSLKIIAHHLGGMVPYFEGRVGYGWDQLGSRTSDEDLGAVLQRLKKRPIDYFKMFYADTAVFGGRPATVCGLEFFGVDNVLFASDAPFDPEKGPMYIRETIKIIDELDLSDTDRDKIYWANAVKLLKLKDS
jgi:aminocarboxymuconate-semialdehyde decarboxylase|tara:strand:- start:28734 stop:29762 length:1029 start_codon:yes stop_codon:yes gene_type:complete